MNMSWAWSKQGTSQSMSSPGLRWAGVEGHLPWIQLSPSSSSSLVAQALKNLPANAGDLGLIPGLGRYPEEGNGNPLQYSCLGNPMDRGAWQATVQGSQRVRHNWATKQHHHLGPCDLHLNCPIVVHGISIVRVPRGKELPKWPPVIPASWYSWLCMYGLDHWLNFNEQNTAEGMGYHFWEEVIKDFPLFHILCLSDSSQVFALIE